MTEGMPLTLTGTYVNGTPTGFTYQVYGQGPVLTAVSPVISGGNWSFVITAPPTVWATDAPPNNTFIVVNARGVGGTAITGNFTVNSAPSLRIVPPFARAVLCTDAALPSVRTFRGADTGEP